MKVCIICADECTESEFITKLCCQNIQEVCIGCFYDYLNTRPIHNVKTNWRENGPQKNKVIRVGPGEDEVWYRCPVTRCLWEKDGLIKFKNETKRIMDMVPEGFNGEDAMRDLVQFGRLYEKHLEKIYMQGHGGVPLDVDDIDIETMAAEIEQGELRNAPGETAWERDVERTGMMIVGHNMTWRQAQDYLISHDLLEVEGSTTGRDDPIEID